MKDDLNIILHLLSDIETRGKRNMNNLLLSIQMVEKLIATMPEGEQQ